MRRSNDCVTGCRRNTEDSGNERGLRRVCRFSAGSRGVQRARKRKQRTSKSCAALPGHARSFANAELVRDPCEPHRGPSSQGWRSRRIDVWSMFHVSNVSERAGLCVLRLGRQDIGGFRCGWLRTPKQCGGAAGIEEKVWRARFAGRGCSSARRMRPHDAGAGTHRSRSVAGEHEFRHHRWPGPVPRNLLHGPPRSRGGLALRPAMRGQRGALASAR